MAISGYSSISSNMYTPNVSSTAQSLASGQRINQAADDSAGLAIVNALNTQINTQDIGVQNANTGVSMLQTADSASNSINSYLQRMNELATQASNGTLNSSQQDSLNQEFQQNLQAIDQIAQSTSFNGQNLLNGDSSSISLALGDSSTDVNLPTLTSSGLSISGLDISSSGDTSTALQNLGVAIEQVSNQRSEFGAQQNALSSYVDNGQNQSVNSSAASSQISDTDYAKTIADQVKQDVLLDSSIAMQAHTNQSRASVLQLLNS